LPYHLEDCPKPTPNDKTIRSHQVFGDLFKASIPDSIPGFEIDEDDIGRMEEIWPAGEEVAQQMLDRFLRSKARTSQLGEVNPLEPGEERNEKKSRAMTYDSGRDKVDSDSTSRLSPYLAAGVISARTCILEILKLTKTKKVPGTRDTGLGMWVQEVAWRDFYTEVLIEFPRVSMGRPYNEKFADVVWEEDEELLKAWKEGKTGVPIVDAGMRQLQKMGKKESSL
jgi:deoxyribodipyrimidine photo-lyase